MKKIIMKAELLTGVIQEFEFFHIQLLYHSNPEKTTYIKYKGESLPLKSETIEFDVADKGGFKPPA